MKKAIFAFVLGATIAVAGAVRADLLLYGTVSNNLYSVDETSGTASLIGPLGSINFLNTLASIETVVAVPEPPTLTLFVLGLAALGFMARRRRRPVDELMEPHVRG